MKKVWIVEIVVNFVWTQDSEWCTFLDAVNRCKIVGGRVVTNDRYGYVVVRPNFKE